MASKRTAAQALQDVRKMHRAVKMRESEDPAEVSQLLNVVLREVIAIREAAGGTLGSNAVRELRDIRSDMVAGHINAGPNTGRMIAKYSVVLDELDKLEPENMAKEGGSSMSIPGNFSMSSIVPSSESLISALITANPVLGYTTKIARDFFSGMSERKKAEEERGKEALQEAKAKAEMYETELDAFEQARESGADLSEEDWARNDVLSDKLEVIKSEIHELNAFLQEVWGDNTMDKVTEQTDEGNQQLQRLNEQEEEARRRAEAKDRADELLERERQFEDQGASDGVASFMNDIGADDKGMLSGLFGGVGLLAGKILAPFMGLFKFFFGGAKIIAGLKIGLLGGALSSIVGFVDGLFNASEIVGKEDVTIGERIQAAFASMITGFLKPINWIAGFFGYEFIDDYMEFTRSVYQTIDEWKEKFAGWVGDAVEWFVDVFNLPLTIVKGILGEVTEFFEDPSGYAAKVWDSITGLVDSSIEFVQDMFSSILNVVNETFEYMKDMVTGFAGRQVDRFKNFWGIGKSDEEKLDERYAEAEQAAQERAEQFPELVETRERLLSEQASRMLHGEADLLDQAIQSGVVRDPDGRLANRSSQSNVLVNNQNTNVINNSTNIIRGSSFNSDPSMRRRTFQAGTLRFGN